MTQAPIPWPNIVVIAITIITFGCVFGAIFRRCCCECHFSKEPK